MDRWWSAGQRKCEGAVTTSKQNYPVLARPPSTYALFVEAMEVRFVQPKLHDAPQSVGVSWPIIRHERVRQGNLGDKNAALRGRVPTERLDKPLHKWFVALTCHDEPHPLQKQAFPHLRAARYRVNSPNLASSIILSRLTTDMDLPVVLRLFREVAFELPFRPRDKKLIPKTDK
ncbi:hypothetical protein [Burkholderia gladioli]|uniref:hypothetical protein n=1 Tax=Burkholderia gladioli TaxID=28095 RepID=UPI001ABA9FBB